MSTQAYFAAKAYFAGILIGSILYGMLIVLFSKCMTALFNPIYRKGESVKWGLVSYAMVTFSLTTILTASNLNVQSISYIDNRNFPGIVGALPPGPLGYMLSISAKATGVLPNAIFPLNGWLADGFLLYRCYVIYYTNPWVIAFPCLMYLGTIGLGIVLIYQTTTVMPGAIWFGLPYLSLSLSLNVVLTLMIVVRLVLHGKNVRAATGSPAGISGLYKTIATMLIESSALFAVTSMLAAGPQSSVMSNIFMPALAVTQVIAPLLIIQRVANKSALTSDSIALENISSFRARTREELTGGSSALPGGDTTDSVGRHGVDFSGELGIGVETTINSHGDRT